MDRTIVWLLVWALAVVGFAALVLFAGRRGRRRTRTPSSPSPSTAWARREDVADAYDASMIVGYMPGHRQRIEHRDDTTVSRVEPLRPGGAGRVDLARGVVRVRRETSG